MLIFGHQIYMGGARPRVVEGAEKKTKTKQSPSELICSEHTIPSLPHSIIQMRQRTDIFTHCSMAEQMLENSI